MLVYECEGNFTEKDFDQGVDCNNVANMPYAKCKKANIVAVWAVGGEVRAFYMPSNFVLTFY